MKLDSSPPLTEADANPDTSRFSGERVISRGAPGNDSAPTLPRRVLEAIDTPFFVFSCQDECQSIYYANPAFERWSGRTSAELLARDWRLVTGIPAGDAELARVTARIEAGCAARALLRRHGSDGSASWIEIQFAPLSSQRGARTQYAGQLRDVTAEMNDREQLRHSAFHDALTGLPNRHLLLDRLEQAITNARTRGSGCAVVFLDLDRFKQVNDTFGHQVGDELLQQVAKRLRHVVRDGDTVARMYGDEFVLILAPASDEDTTEKISRRVTDWISLPFVIRGQSIGISCSVGVARFSDGADGPQLIADADLEMYRRKRLNRAPDGS